MIARDTSLNGTRTKFSSGAPSVTLPWLFTNRLVNDGRERSSRSPRGRAGGAIESPGNVAASKPGRMVRCPGGPGV